VGDRDVGDGVAGGEDVPRQAFPLGADDERQFAGIRQLVQRHALARDERDAPPGEIGQRPHARDRHREHGPARDKGYTTALAVLSLEVYYRYYLPLLRVR
jgi:hypothetical protein